MKERAEGEVKLKHKLIRPYIHRCKQKNNMVIVLEHKNHVVFLLKCLVKSKISKYIFTERIIVNLAKIRL